MTVIFERLSKVFNALIPNTVNKSPRMIFFEHGKFGIAKTARPLDEALRAHDHAEVERLLKKGANPNLRTHFTGPALNEAVRTGDLALVKTVIEHGGDINGVNMADTCALHMAVSELRDLPQQKDILEYLLSLNPRLDIKNSCHATPLEWAKQLGDEEGERVLAKAAGVDPLVELKPFLQKDGSYLFDAKVELLETNSLRIDVPSFRKFYTYVKVKDNDVELEPVAKAIAGTASTVFGLEDAKIGYRGNA
jgi:ankyrin repeat protein